VEYLAESAGWLIVVCQITKGRWRTTLGDDVAGRRRRSGCAAAVNVRQWSQLDWELTTLDFES
jgi:hypothetical protein